MKEWSNVDKASWIMEKAKISMKKIDFHDYEGLKAERIQDDLIDILAEYFDDNWKDEAYSEEEQEEDEQAVIDDLRYLDEIDRRLGL